MVCNMSALVVLGLFFSIFFNSYTSAEQPLVPALFLFGDSMIDVGNNNYLNMALAKANMKHNGIDFPTGKPTGRFSNGKITPDFLAEKLGFTATQPAYLELKNKKMDNAASFINGVNFASSAAGVLNYSLPELLERIQLSKQVEYYISVYKALVEELSESGAQQRISKSLFVVSLGTTDLATYAQWPTLQIKYTKEQFKNLVISTLKQHLKRLYNNGARKLIISGLGVLGCMPMQRVQSPTGECNEEANFWADKYNQDLKIMLQELHSELPDFPYIYLDIYNGMENILRNPIHFGFTEIKSACCGLGKLNAAIHCTPISNYCSNRNQHFFWDMFHPSEATIRIFMNAFFNIPGNFSFPITLRELIAI